MARTSLKPVEIPEGISLENQDKKLVFSGKLGELSLQVHEDVDIKQEENSISFNPNKKTKESIAITGTMRALASNMIQGVEEGFTKNLEVNGVGYRASVGDGILTLQLGFSHDIKLAIPDDLDVKCTKPTEISISGIDKQKVGQFASEIRSFRKPEPYKGKGIKYSDEIIRRKEGKKK